MTNQTLKLGYQLVTAIQQISMKSNVYKQDVIVPLFSASWWPWHIISRVVKDIQKDWLEFLEYDWWYSKITLKSVDSVTEFLWQICHICPFLHFAEKLDQTAKKTRQKISTRWNMICTAGHAFCKTTESEVLVGIFLWELLLFSNSKWQFNNSHEQKPALIRGSERATRSKICISPQMTGQVYSWDICGRC